MDTNTKSIRTNASQLLADKLTKMQIGKIRYEAVTDLTDAAVYIGKKYHVQCGTRNFTLWKWDGQLLIILATWSSPYNINEIANKIKTEIKHSRK